MIVVVLPSYVLFLEGTSDTLLPKGGAQVPPLEPGWEGHRTIVEVRLFDLFKRFNLFI